MQVQTAFIRQYHVSLEMLGRAVKECPESLWLDSEFTNKFWHIAYHALYYAYLYLHASEQEFRPWPAHKPEHQFLGPLPWPPHDTPKIEAPFSKAQVLECHDICRSVIENKVRTVGLELPSGFAWLPFTRAELHVYNIRHIQHHTGQLIDRLRTREGISIGWLGAL